MWKVIGLALMIFGVLLLIVSLPFRFWIGVLGIAFLIVGCFLWRL